MSTRVLFMNRAYAGVRTTASACGAALLGERLADDLRDRLHLDRRAGHLAEHLVRRHPLALAPQLAQERAGAAVGEPGAAELLAQERPHLRLEGPRAEVRGDVEAGVDVPKVVGGARLDLQGVAEQLDVARGELRHVVGGVELALVQELRAVAADEVEEARRALGGELVRPREVEA